jgi:hypothetical protein
MTHRQTVESRISIVDRITDDQLSEMRLAYRGSPNIISLINNLSAWREAPEDDDAEADELRQRCAAAEVMAAKAKELLKEWVVKVESPDDELWERTERFLEAT